ncbi:MAG: D-aminoacylase [Pirellulales bacterium]|nr:D-aminoacylase [Pirellulales bacterium]
MPLDLAILNARILEGMGSPAYLGAVGIEDSRICYVGPGRELAARRTINAQGMVVCPGFIDMHSHSDLLPLAEPACLAKMMQGVTTEVIGQDGLSYAPLTDETLPFFRTAFRGLNGDPDGLVWDWRSTAEYLDRFDRRAAVNIAMLAPHGNLRAAAMGLENRPPTPDELRRMTRLLDESMREGAFGLSTGLTYAPASYAATGELVELCRVVGRHGGYFAPHLRNYGRTMEAAVEEAIQVCTQAELPLHLTHFHASFTTGRGKAGDYLARLNRARSYGLEITLDAYPYVAASTFMAGLLPGWACDGGTARLLERLAEPATRERIRYEMEITGCDGMQGLPAQWEALVVTDTGGGKCEDWIGRSLRQIADEIGQPPFQCFADLLVESELAASCVWFIGNEDNLQQFMRDPQFMAGSDGLLVGRRPHPRAWGTFARYLARYVRELRILTLEECVRKMTSLPASRLGLTDRGILRTGMSADLVIFDPDTVQDTATYENPRSHPEGIPYVLVNGQLVKDRGRPTGALPGRALRRGVP